MERRRSTFRGHRPAIGAPEGLNSKARGWQRGAQRRDASPGSGAPRIPRPEGAEPGCRKPFVSPLSAIYRSSSILIVGGNPDSGLSGRGIFGGLHPGLAPRRSGSALPAPGFTLRPLRGLGSPEYSCGLPRSRTIGHRCDEHCSSHAVEEHPVAREQASLIGVVAMKVAFRKHAHEAAVVAQGVRTVGFAMGRAMSQEIPGEAEIDEEVEEEQGRQDHLIANERRQRRSAAISCRVRRSRGFI